jgi:hypothetical protein
MGTSKTHFGTKRRAAGNLAELRAMISLCARHSVIVGKRGGEQVAVFKADFESDRINC